MPEHAQFKEEDWRSYEQANRRFAETALANITGAMPIWVNDYHLLLVPGLIRARGLRQRIAFFLHIPFPSDVAFRQGPLASNAVVRPPRGRRRWSADPHACGKFVSGGRWSPRRARRSPRQPDPLCGTMHEDRVISDRRRLPTVRSLGAGAPKGEDGRAHRSRGRSARLHKGPA